MNARSPIIPSDVPAVREHIPAAPAYGNIDRRMLRIAGDLAFIDVETTGVDPDVDAIVEIAIVRFRNGAPEVFHSLVNPGFPIPPTASAVHHITDETVKDAPRIEELAPRIRSLLDGAVRGAHNAAFDALFVDPAIDEAPEPKKWICSLRLARHLMPEAPAYGNMVLRYWLKTNPKSEGLGAHRAIDDVYVSLETMWHLLSLAQQRGMQNLEQVRTFCHETIYTTTMNFGAHAGKPLSEVPSEWLEWALGRIPGKEGLSDMDDDLRASLEREISIPNRAGPAVVPAEVMLYGKAHHGKPMREVPRDYLEWMEREQPRCSREIREGVRVELARRRGEDPSAAASVPQAPARPHSTPKRDQMITLVAVLGDRDIKEATDMVDEAILTRPDSAEAAPPRRRRAP